MSPDGGNVAAVQHRVPCPGCGVILKVPARSRGSRVRCPKCRHSFHLDGGSTTEDRIADWLDGDDAAHAKAPIPVKSPEPAAAAPTQAEPAGPVKEASGAIRLVKFDRGSALLEFPAGRLEDPTFRCAMPRQCLQCGTRTNLVAHMIIYASHLVTSVSLEEERTAEPLALSDHEVQTLGCEELLAQLPNVPNVPHPGDLPMPYWLCDMCAGSGTISGEIHVDDSGKGQCRLLICNLHRAEEFMAAAGGTGSAEHAKLKQYLAEVTESPWEMVSLVVQHRLQQWFSPRKDERFLGYVPDRDRSRTEDGMAGLVISSGRLIYHSRARHREVTQTETVELNLAMSGNKGNLGIKAPSWDTKHFTVDREGLACLRRSLTLGKYKVAWR